MNRGRQGGGSFSDKCARPTMQSVSPAVIVSTKLYRFPDQILGMMKRWVNCRARQQVSFDRQLDCLSLELQLPGHSTCFSSQPAGRTERTTNLINNPSFCSSC